MNSQGVDWPFGDKQIHHRIQRGGLISAVTESFHPSTPHDYAIFLEDDIEVSPAFYAWSKHLLLRYRYSSDAAHPVTLNANTMPTTSLAGISLYTPRIEEVREVYRAGGMKGGWRGSPTAMWRRLMQLLFSLFVGFVVWFVCIRLDALMPLMLLFAQS